MKKRHLSLQMKFLLSIIFIIVPVLGIIFTWFGIQNEKQAMNQVMDQARVLSRQIILTRKWITDCGGVMVPLNSLGTKNISCFYDDRMKTSRGVYRKFTPSMVTKQLSRYSQRQQLYKFRLSSLSPINPENQADEFEKLALNHFANHKVMEMSRFEKHGKKQFLHYILPLFVEKGCLECHSQQSISTNRIRGGLSVFLPVNQVELSIKRNQFKLAVSGFAIILLTIFTLFFSLSRMVIKPLKEFENMINEVGKGNLDARANVKTGDELERLGDAFNTMARRLSKGRDNLEEKIDQATLELSEANRELKSLDKLKSDFLANMSHELRSPLTVLRGGIDYLNRTIKIEDNRNYLTIIDKNLTRLTSLVSDLFDFTKLEAKKIELSFEQENLTVLIEEVIEILSPLAFDKKIKIDFKNARDIFVEFDLERIEQVLVNLLDNAIKFSDPETIITIKVVVNIESVVVSVKDHGTGISEKHIKTIFDKFSTVPSGRDGKTEGTGLGLAICKAIIEAHGGRIWAESIKGVSSTFHFSLPNNRVII